MRPRTDSHEKEKKSKEGQIIKLKMTFLCEKEEEVNK